MDFIQWFIVFLVAVVLYGQWVKHRTGVLPSWKYCQPFSVTWWAGLLPGVVGILISGEPLHGWVELTQSLQSATGGTDPQMLIYGSAAAIGLTGKFVK